MPRTSLGYTVIYIWYHFLFHIHMISYMKCVHDDIIYDIILRTWISNTFHMKYINKSVISDMISCAYHDDVIMSWIWFRLSLASVIWYCDIICTFYITKSYMISYISDFTFDFTYIWNHRCWLSWWYPMWFHMLPPSRACPGQSQAQLKMLKSCPGPRSCSKAPCSNQMSLCSSCLSSLASKSGCSNTLVHWRMVY